MPKTILYPVIVEQEVNDCLLCHNPACTKACVVGMDPARILKSLRFRNDAGAKRQIGRSPACIHCAEKSCQTACIKAKLGKPVAISDVITSRVLDQTYPEKETLDHLAITFCGVPCENPFFLSSSVVASNKEMVARAFAAGWAGAAFKTIGTFVPEEVSPRFATIRKEGNSFIGFKNIEQISDHTLEENLAFMRELKQEWPTKVLIASILGQNEDEWTALAKMVEDAGADIIECNFSCPHMSGEGLGSDVGQNPELVARFTAATRRGTKLPILAKMTPNLGNMELPALAAMKNGADGLAAINTIKSIMQVDLNDYVSEPRVHGKSCLGGYSGKAVKPIALRFIHDMKKHPELESVPVSGMGGIEDWRDAAEFIAMGCGTVQITTAVMQYGYRIIEDLLDGLSTHLQINGLESVEQLVGQALHHVVSADSLNRSTINYPMFDRQLCIGCGRCHISCEDGGHQAIHWDMKTEKPRLIPNNCVGCHLCKMVCPAGAIHSGLDIPKAAPYEKDA